MVSDCPPVTDSAQTPLVLKETGSDSISFQGLPAQQNGPTIESAPRPVMMDSQQVDQPVKNQDSNEIYTIPTTQIKSSVLQGTSAPKVQVKSSQTLTEDPPLEWNSPFNSASTSNPYIQDESILTAVEEAKPFHDQNNQPAQPVTTQPAVSEKTPDTSGVKDPVNVPKNLRHGEDTAHQNSARSQHLETTEPAKGKVTPPVTTHQTVPQATPAANPKPTTNRGTPPQQSSPAPLASKHEISVDPEAFEASILETYETAEPFAEPAIEENTQPATNSLPDAGAPQNNPLEPVSNPVTPESSDAGDLLRSFRGDKSSLSAAQIADQIIEAHARTTQEERDKAAQQERLAEQARAEQVAKEQAELALQAIVAEEALQSLEATNEQPERVADQIEAIPVVETTKESRQSAQPQESSSDLVPSRSYPSLMAGPRDEVLGVVLPKSELSLPKVLNVSGVVDQNDSGASYLTSAQVPEPGQQQSESETEQVVLKAIANESLLRKSIVQLPRATSTPTHQVSTKPNADQTRKPNLGDIEFLITPLPQQPRDCLDRATNDFEFQTVPSFEVPVLRAIPVNEQVFAPSQFKIRYDQIKIVPAGGRNPGSIEPIKYFEGNEFESIRGLTRRHNGESIH